MNATCAKFTGENKHCDPTWCNAPATKATLCNPKDGFLFFNIGHWYCDAHAPADAVALPAGYDPMGGKQS